jgi:hypothetical protein
MNLHTRTLLTISSLFLLAMGVVLTFAPEETLHYFGMPAWPPLQFLAQSAGGLYLGFAILDWMSKYSVIGGIYGRPLVMGNFLHFFAVAATLARSGGMMREHPIFRVLLAVYVLLAVWFGLVLRTNPSAESTS